METNDSMPKEMATRKGDKIERFTLAASNYDVDETPEDEMSSNMLGHNVIPQGIKRYSDLLYVAEAHHLYSGGVQGGASTETNQPTKSRFMQYQYVDDPHLPNQPNIPNPYRNHFTKTAYQGKIYHTGDTYENVVAPTYNGHIIAADSSDRVGHLVFGPYHILTPSKVLPTHYNSYFFIGDLDGISPNETLLTFEIGIDTPNGFHNLIRPLVLRRSAVKGNSDAMFTTIRMSTNEMLRGVEQRIVYHGKGYVEFFQNWCYRPRS